MRDSIRDLSPEVVDALRIILHHHPERATLDPSAGREERLFDIAFCAAAETTFAAAERRTNVKRGVIAKYFIQLRRSYSHRIRQLVLGTPEIYQEAACVLGITNWPLFEQDELTDKYKRSCGSQETLEAFLSKHREHQLFAGLVSEWLLAANGQIHDLQMKNGNLVERLRLIARIIDDDELFTRISNQLMTYRGEPEQSGFHEMQIEDLELSTRTFNCLMREGIRTLGELAQCTEERLSRIRNWGKRSQDEVDEILKKYEVGQFFRKELSPEEAIAEMIAEYNYAPPPIIIDPDEVE